MVETNVALVIRYKDVIAPWWVVEAHVLSEASAHLEILFENACEADVRHLKSFKFCLHVDF